MQALVAGSFRDPANSLPADIMLFMMLIEASPVAAKGSTCSWYCAVISTDCSIKDVPMLNDLRAVRFVRAPTERQDWSVLWCLPRPHLSLQEFVL